MLLANLGPHIPPCLGSLHKVLKVQTYIGLNVLYGVALHCFWCSVLHSCMMFAVPVVRLAKSLTGFANVLADLKSLLFWPFGVGPEHD